MSEHTHSQVDFVLERAWKGKEFAPDGKIPVAGRRSPQTASIDYTIGPVEVHPEFSYRLILTLGGKSRVLIAIEASLIDPKISAIKFEVSMNQEGAILDCVVHGAGEPLKHRLFADRRMESFKQEVHRLREDASDRETRIVEIANRLRVAQAELRTTTGEREQQATLLLEKDKQVQQTQEQIASLSRNCQTKVQELEQGREKCKQLEKELEEQRRKLSLMELSQKGATEQISVLQSSLQAKSRSYDELQRTYSAFEQKSKAEHYESGVKIKGLEDLLRDKEKTFHDSLVKTDLMMRERQLYYPLYIRVFLFMIRWLDREFKMLQANMGIKQGPLASQVQAVYISDTGLPGMLALAAEKTSELMAACFSRPIDESLMSVPLSDFLEKLLLPKSVLFLDSRCSLVDRIVRMYVYSHNRELAIECSDEEREFHRMAFELVRWYFHYFLDIAITYPDLMHESYDQGLYRENVKRSFLSRELTGRESRDALKNLLPGTIFDFETCGYAFGKSWKGTSLADLKVLPLVSKILS